MKVRPLVIICEGCRFDPAAVCVCVCVRVLVWCFVYTVLLFLWGHAQDTTDVILYFQFCSTYSWFSSAMIQHVQCGVSVSSSHSVMLLFHTCQKSSDEQIKAEMKMSLFFNPRFLTFNSVIWSNLAESSCRHFILVLDSIGQRWSHLHHLNAARLDSRRSTQSQIQHLNPYLTHTQLVIFTPIRDQPNTQFVSSSEEA